MNIDPPWLEAMSNVASSITGCVAAYYGIAYQYRRRRNRMMLEMHLMRCTNRGSFTPEPALAAAVALGITESEVMAAAVRSKIIDRSTSAALQGMPSRILLKRRGSP